MDSRGHHTRQGLACPFPPEGTPAPPPSPTCMVSAAPRPLPSMPPWPAPRFQGLRASPTTSHMLNSLMRLTGTGCGVLGFRSWLWKWRQLVFLPTLSEASGMQGQLERDHPCWVVRTLPSTHL